MEDPLLTEPKLSSSTDVILDTLESLELRPDLVYYYVFIEIIMSK